MGEGWFPPGWKARLYGRQDAHRYMRYLLALKDNQERVQDEVKTFLDAAVLERSATRPEGAKLSSGAANLNRWRRITAGWKRGATIRARSWLGLPTGRNEKGCSRLGW